MKSLDDCPRIQEQPPCPDQDFLRINDSIGISGWAGQRTRLAPDFEQSAQAWRLIAAAIEKRRPDAQ